MGTPGVAITDGQEHCKEKTLPPQVPQRLHNGFFSAFSEHFTVCWTLCWLSEYWQAFWLGIPLDYTGILNSLSNPFKPPISTVLLLRPVKKKKKDKQTHRNTKATMNGANLLCCRPSSHTVTWHLPS